MPVYYPGKFDMKISALILQKYPFLVQITKDVKIASATIGAVNDNLLDDYPTSTDHLKRILFIGGSGQIVKELLPEVSLFNWRRPWTIFSKLPADTVITGIRDHIKDPKQLEAIFHIVILRKISASDLWQVILYNSPSTSPDFERWVIRKCGE